VILRDVLEQLLTGKSLSEEDASALLRALTQAETPPAMSGALLAALRSKGITAEFKRYEATFKVALPKADLKKQLDEYAKKNEHMKGWSFMEPEKDSKKS
jgi:anthranilate phosphoribosyltransferase